MIEENYGGVAGRTNSYNHQGLLSNSATTNGLLRSLVYDIRDRPITVTDSAGAVTSLTYDALDRVTSVAMAGAGTNTFLDTARGMTNWVDALRRTNWCVYDAAGRRPTPRGEIPHKKTSGARRSDAPYLKGDINQRRATERRALPLSAGLKLRTAGPRQRCLGSSAGTFPWATLRGEDSGAREFHATGAGA